MIFWGDVSLLFQEQSKLTLTKLLLEFVAHHFVALWAKIINLLNFAPFFHLTYFLSADVADELHCDLLVRPSFRTEVFQVEVHVLRIVQVATIRKYLFHWDTNVREVVAVFTATFHRHHPVSPKADMGGFHLLPAVGAGHIERVPDHRFLQKQRRLMMLTGMLCPSVVL